MKRRFPLYLKIVLWFVLNLVVLGLVGFFIFAGRFGLDLLVSGPVAARIGTVSEAITAELRARPSSEWDAVLEKSASAHGVKFVLFQDDGTELAGEKISLPDEVREHLKGPPQWRRPEMRHIEHPHNGDGPDGFRNGLPMSRQGEDSPRVLLPSDGERMGTVSPAGPVEKGALEIRRTSTELTNAGPRWFGSVAGQPGGNEIFKPPAPRPRFVLRTGNPVRYWIGMPAFLGDLGTWPPRFGTLLVISENLYGGGLFFDLKPIVWAAGWALLFSVLFWFPLVRGITLSLSEMTRATERISQGGFDVRVRVRRRDELGQLGQAVNLMAERLQGFVTGQKRFLGDTAHELCTPLSRIQMVVGILEQRADKVSQSYVNDLREEVQHMSGLVNELLSFSKASLAGAQLKLKPLVVRDIVEQAVQRESDARADIRVEVGSDLEVVGDADLLQRALANLIRNAIRYAGTSGPITVSAAGEGEAVLLKVSDSGPGVPEELVQRLFDPFFRVDDARTRESGGVGLGLTIVKTCVEACGGSVACRNRQPSGLEVLVRLKAGTAKR
jgi:two-component system sensor histidine kinase CpxA